MVAAILLGLVTLVLFAVWHFNRQIPGLRCWTVSYFWGFVFCLTLVLRTYLPEVIAVMLAQASSALAAYMLLLAVRAYMGRPRISHAWAGLGITCLLSCSAYFTVVQPQFNVRFILVSLVVGVLFLLAARTVAHGHYKQVPARYLFALIAAAHGLFLLVRPALLDFDALPMVGALVVPHISSVIFLESIVASLLLAFGILILANEFMTLELRHLAEVDPLTNVFNRRAFLTLLDKSISSAQRSGQLLSVLVIDLDHFKNINDTWGHKGGDEVLRHFVQLANTCLRKEDMLGRLGGEEFAIFLPNAGHDGARAVAERLCGMVESEPVMTAHGSIALTASIGVAVCLPGESSEAALHRADKAMYAAKMHGRNRVELWQASAFNDAGRSSRF